jgi:hypothetical protein
MKTGFLTNFSPHSYYIFVSQNNHAHTKHVFLAIRLNHSLPVAGEKPSDVETSGRNMNMFRIQRRPGISWLK